MYKNKVFSWTIVIFGISLLLGCKKEDQPDQDTSDPDYETGEICFCDSDWTELDPDEETVTTTSTLYIKLKEPTGNDALQETRTARMVATESEASKTITLNETSSSSNTYTGSVNLKTTGVQEDEILTVTASGYSVSILVDNWEVGTGGINDYPANCDLGDLNNAVANANSFYNNLTGLKWTGLFKDNNGDCKESYYDKDGDETSDHGVDLADFVYWSGHQAYWSVYSMHFPVTPHDHTTRPDVQELQWAEVSWGEKDLDWICIDACYFIQPNVNCQNMANGLRMMCGFSTGDVKDLSDFSSIFVQWMTKEKVDERKSIYEAWVKTAEDKQPNAKWCIIGDQYCKQKDYLPGWGTINLDDHAGSYMAWEKP